jgi:CRP/FNR family transcriptional regulator, cyclic AMP receptor protein
MNETRKLLENSRLFKGFTPGVIDAILPLLTPCHFAAEHLICLKGDDSDCLYIIRDGEAEVSVSSQEGKIIVLGMLTQGDVFGEVGMLDKKSRTANVTAKTDISLYRLSNSDFDSVSKLFGSSEFIALTSYICFLFRRVTNNLEEAIFLDASVRVARKIQELYELSSDRKENSFRLSISQENLGRMAGLSREATNKALSRLEETGLIERKYKHITVGDMKKFTQALNDDVIGA